MAVEFNWVNSGLATGTGYTSYSPTSSGFGLSTKNLENVNNYNQTKQGISTSNAAMESAFESDVDTLISYVSDGKEDYALDKFNEMMDYWGNSENSTLYSNLNEKELKALIRTKVEEQNEDGLSLEELIRENTWSGCFIGTKLGLSGDSACKEDLLSEMCEVNDSRPHWWQNIGKFFGGQ